MRVFVSLQSLRFWSGFWLDIFAWISKDQQFVRNAGFERLPCAHSAPSDFDGRRESAQRM